jgi:hypothetical protein
VVGYVEASMGCGSDRRITSLGTTAAAAVLLWAGLFACTSSPPPMPACAAHWPAVGAIASGRPGVGTVLAPLGAVVALVCEYQVYLDSSTRAITGDLTIRKVVTGADLSDLNTTFNVPVQIPPCSGGRSGSSPAAEFVFRYSSGPDVSILMSYLSICGPPDTGKTGFTATNGTISGYFSADTTSSMVLFQFNGPRA